MRKLYFLLAFLAGMLNASAQSTPGDSCRAEFSVQQNGNVAPFVLALTAQSWHNHQKPVTKVCWDFGDGTAQLCHQSVAGVAPSLNVTHTYTDSGIYTICVTLTYDGGCVSYKCRQVVLPAPITAPDSCHVNFSWTQPTSTLQTLSFVAGVAHNHQKPATQICWNWGDGQSTCINYPNGYNGESVLHHYAQSGTYNACATANFQGGCQSNTCHSVTVPPSVTVPDSCHVSFSSVAAAINTLEQTFTASPVHNHQKPVTKLCWTWGDGLDTCITYTNGYNYQGLHHQYATAGTYTVCVTATFDGGCQSYSCHAITVTAPMPVADSCRAYYTFAPVTATPLARTFIAQPWHNHQKRVTKIHWMWGDGRDTTLTYAAGNNGPYAQPHTYLLYGTYNVCATIVYEGGCQSYFCSAVVIATPPPVTPSDTSCHAAFSSTGATANPLLRYFTANAGSSHRAIWVKWYFGDGQYAQLPLPNPVTPASLSTGHQYAAPGNYQVCVRIGYDGGCEAQWCQSAFVSGPGNCSASIQDSVLSNNAVRFHGTATISAGDSVIGWKWSFGDGTYSIDRNPTHSYLGGGNYQVCLSIRTRNGCVATSCVPVTINAPALTLLTLLPNPVSTVLHAQFYALTGGPATIRIINAMGLTVRLETRPGYAGINLWDFGVGNLPAGYYTMIVQQGSQYATGHFYKQ